MTIDVMIDLETASLAKNAAILSIGAVKFDLDKGELGDTFYQNIELSSCIDLGLHKSQSTIDWWEKEENREARDSLTKNAVTIQQALVRFIDWTGNDIIPGSNGAPFDIVILEAAMSRCYHRVPWKFYNESCYRTFKRLYRSQVPAPEFIGIKHNALADAIYQANHLIAIFKRLHVAPLLGAGVGASVTYTDGTGILVSPVASPYGEVAAAFGITGVDGLACGATR